MSFLQPLSPTSPPIDIPFVDRRQPSSKEKGAGERRQFGNSYHNLSREGRQLAEAIDTYKLEFRRRYITTDELLSVILNLGYTKAESS